MTASHLSRCVEIYFESNVQLTCRTGVIVSGFLAERRRARSERHARRGNASHFARVSCLGVPCSHRACFVSGVPRSLRARPHSSDKCVKTTLNGQMWTGRLGTISLDIDSSKYTAKTLPHLPQTWFGTFQ